MPPLASAVEPAHTVSRSSTITRPAPSRARWYAVLTPMMPAPTITTSAVRVMRPRQRGRTCVPPSFRFRRHGVGAHEGRAGVEPTQRRAQRARGGGAPAALVVADVDDGVA